ncbi:MAG: dehydrogenase subunit [Bacteroidetes bacterium]|nr:dehydrogenase subunit [Bacteroidota bacterium]
MSQYFKNIWDGVLTVLIGMKVTWRHLFTPAVTIQYPDVRLQLPDRARNRLYVNMDDCIGCDQCAMACPVDCITIETVKSTPDVDLGLTSVGTKKRLYVPRFDIDIAKCCYCGLCVPPCPTECIKMTDVYEFSEYDRQSLIYNFAVMTPDAVAEAKAKLAAHEKEQAAKKAAAAAAPKPAAPRPATPAPSGAAPQPAAPAGAPTPAPPAPPAAEEKKADPTPATGTNI